jgi:mRNA-degrading endonuclease RelE of RelBE toxin-antitoxin system
MNSIDYANEFKRRLKPLSKKYHSLRQSVDALVTDLLINPFLGESYGKNIYKIRLADKSKGKGKSGGFRVIYYLTIKTEDSINIMLVTIYDKSEIDTIKKDEVLSILNQILSEPN